MPSNQILSGQARLIRTGEMALDPGPRAPVGIDTRSAVGAVQADASAFASADLGRAQMGEAVGRVGDHMERLALAQMDAINLTKRAEAQNLMTAAEGEMGARLAKEPDEMKWPALAAEHMEKTRASIGKLALSPVAKAAVESDFSRWEAHRVSGVKVDSAQESIRKARSAINEKVSLATATQDSGMLEANLQGAVAGGFMTEDAAALYRLRFTDEGKQKAKEAEALKYDNGQNAAVVAASEGGAERALKALDSGELGQYSPTQQERLRNVIQSVSRDRGLETTANIADDIATGKITTPEQVDSFASQHLRPADREALKSDLIKRASAAEKARLDDPDVQFSIYGQLLARGQAWNPHGPDAEKEYFAIHREALQLPEGLRGEVTGPIERRRTGKPPEPDDTLTDYARDRLTRLYDRGAMGNWKVPGGVDKDGKKLPDSENTPVRDAASIVLSKTQRGISRWLKANPNASEEAIDAEMQRMMAGHVDSKQAAELLDEMNREGPPDLGPPAGGPATAVPTGGKATKSAGDPATAVPTGGKATKFGYAADPNKDSLSAKRIAAFSGSAAEAAAAAGEDHPLLLSQGDLAVSPDVEAELRGAGVKPGDFVKVTFKDGTTRVSRWMDRTADDAQAKKLGLNPLRGRWDFFAPDGQDSLDGQPVVSFTPVKNPQ